jgi:hypothetical protein
VTHGFRSSVGLSIPPYYWCLCGLGGDYRAIYAHIKAAADEEAMEAYRIACGGSPGELHQGACCESCEDDRAIGAAPDLDGACCCRGLAVRSLG